MEDGAKEDPAQSKVPKFLGKAGWVKKAPAKLLATYKDRFIQVERTEMVVYENEDLQNCLERVNLENYDDCHELKSSFSKKQRLILIRSPKSGNKVSDVKFRTQNAEEKEAWIKALNDGINRAKNKVFDEVKVDEGSNLEHVTRSRPKGNRNRRPPTRIHMKEVADVSSDGILRLDLDLEDAIMPNGTHQATVDGKEIPKEAKKVPMPSSNAKDVAEKQLEPLAEEVAETEPEATPQKKVIKPPMPPVKEVKWITTPEEGAEKSDGSEKKVVKPPMPPTKEAKPSSSPVEETSEDAKTEKISEKSPDAKKKTGPPPAPPSKPTNSSMKEPAEALQSKSNTQPPAPPSKEKKPPPPAEEPNQEVQGTTDENKEKEEDNKKETTITPVGTNEALPSVRDDKTPSTEGQVCEEESGETVNKASNSEPQVPVSQSQTESPRKSPSPPLSLKKKPSELHEPNTLIEDNTTGTGEEPTSQVQTASNTSIKAEEALSKIEVQAVVVSLNDPVVDSLSLSPLLGHLPGEKKKKAEEKSVDSGQHSDIDSEGSVEDTLAASTAAMRGSHPALDVLDACEDEIQISVNLKPAQAATKPQVAAKVFPIRRPRPTTPLKPSTKAKSASSGDLLSDFSDSAQVRQQSRTVSGSDGAPGDDVTKLETEVTQEMEKTGELLSRVSQSQDGKGGEGMPEDLLAKAMEKLKMADNVLREVKKLKLAKNLNNRNSW
ncbi:pleckstrin homology domain-containing family O member 2 [Scomber japonicus]|uniref:pleckstrin homology domain-containing family O member 2 n=1 Tax=Scomber japonicus TaxID=13676 RepID=UPI002306CCD7|nr:pleckstrin homology domain-containing family O member 2 [Scomber japonicus]